MLELASLVVIFLQKCTCIQGSQLSCTSCIVGFSASDVCIQTHDVYSQYLRHYNIHTCIQLLHVCSTWLLTIIISLHKLTITTVTDMQEVCATAKSHFQHEKLLHVKLLTSKQAAER